jgi:hypothetical protein
MKQICPVMSPLLTPLSCPLRIIFMISYPGTRSPCRFKGKEAHPWLDKPLDKAMVLLDQIIY